MSIISTYIQPSIYTLTHDIKFYFLTHFPKREKENLLTITATIRCTDEDQKVRNRLYNLYAAAIIMIENVMRI